MKIFIPKKKWKNEKTLVRTQKEIYVVRINFQQQYYEGILKHAKEFFLWILYHSWQVRWFCQLNRPFHHSNKKNLCYFTHRGKGPTLQHRPRSYNSQIRVGLLSVYFISYILIFHKNFCEKLKHGFPLLLANYGQYARTYS